MSKKIRALLVSVVVTAPMVAALAAPSASASGASASIGPDQSYQGKMTYSRIRWCC